MFVMRAVMLVQLPGAVRPLEIMLLASAEAKTNQDGEEGETFHQRLS